MTRAVSAATGAVLMVGLRWTDRLIGFVSTVILARLLVPEDFGVVAMAAIIVGLADVLLDMGVNITLIQNRTATQDDYNAAWTLRLIQCSLAALLVFAAAEPAAAYFDDPRVAPVARFLALSLLLAGCENIGVVEFQKHMEFGREFQFFFTKRIASFLVTIAAAWILENYWALVIGTLSGRALGCVLSYTMHSMRPRLSLKAVRPMLVFSKWNLLRGIGGYLNQNLHRIFVGRRESTAVMGAYSLGGEIAALPSSELLAPLNRVLFPVFVKLKHDLVQLKHAFLLALAVQVSVGIPASAGLIVISNELVHTLLGETWMPAVPFIQILAATNIMQAVGLSGWYLLLALGRANLAAYSSWFSVVIFVSLAMLAIPNGGASAIATLRLAVAAAGFLLFVFLVKREFPTFRTLEMLSSIWRPFLASAFMIIGLLAWPPGDGMTSILVLLIKIAFGASVYTACLVILWRMVGCPDGAERYLLEKAKLEKVVRRVLRAR